MEYKTGLSLNNEHNKTFRISTALHILLNQGPVFHSCPQSKVAKSKQTFQDRKIEKFS